VVAVGWGWAAEAAAAVRGRAAAAAAAAAVRGWAVEVVTEASATSDVPLFASQAAFPGVTDARVRLRMLQ
jgi:hypothetical protein